MNSRQKRSRARSKILRPIEIRGIAENKFHDSIRFEAMHIAIFNYGFDLGF